MCSFKSRTLKNLHTYFNINERHCDVHVTYMYLVVRSGESDLDCEEWDLLNLARKFDHQRLELSRRRVGVIRDLDTYNHMFFAASGMKLAPSLWVGRKHKEVVRRRSLPLFCHLARQPSGQCFGQQQVHKIHGEQGSWFITPYARQSFCHSPVFSLVILND